jgi:hypothetical protein
LHVFDQPVGQDVAQLVAERGWSLWYAALPSGVDGPPRGGPAHAAPLASTSLRARRTDVSRDADPLPRDALAALVEHRPTRGGLLHHVANKEAMVSQPRGVEL